MLALSGTAFAGNEHKFDKDETLPGFHARKAHSSSSSSSSSDSSSYKAHKGFKTPINYMAIYSQLPLTTQPSKKAASDTQVVTPGPQGPQGAQGPQGIQGLQGPQGEQGQPGKDGAPGKDGEPGKDGADGQMGPQGPQGIQGEKGERGPQGLAGGIVAAGDFYAIIGGTLSDNAMLIAPGNDVAFPQAPNFVGISVTPLNAYKFNLSEPGTYQVFFQIGAQDEAQFVVALDGIEVPHTQVGQQSGSGQVVGMSLITTKQPNVALSIRNPENSPKAVQLTAGYAHLMITQLQ